jgi:radical SAM superfamily enzyme YgiQ (UPF0313 family)
VKEQGMKALVVSTNRYRNPAPVMPVGACLVAEAAERAGHRAALLDLMFERDPVRALESALDRERPEVIGLSVRNIDNNDAQRPRNLYEDLAPLMAALRRKTPAPVVLGGAAVGVMPEALLRYTGASWASLGDGEAVFPALLDALAAGRPPRETPGLAWLEDGALVRSRAAPHWPLGSAAPGGEDGCPVPDYRRWLRMSSYRSLLTAAAVQTKRGCPFDCVYCTYAALEGRTYRLCEPESVARAVRSLTAAGLRDIEFVDNVFNAPREHGQAVCEALARDRHGARLQSLELSPRFLDDELLSAMEAAGFVAMGITIESAADAVLARMRKGFTAEDVRRAAEVVRRHRIPCLWILLFGGPGETEATVRETLDFVHRSVRPQDVVFYNWRLRVYPGTELERMARAEGVLEAGSDGLLKPAFYFSPGMDSVRLDETLRRFAASHLNCVSLESVGLPLLPMIQRAASRIGARPPMWRHTRLLRRTLRLFNRSL